MQERTVAAPAPRRGRLNRLAGTAFLALCVPAPLAGQPALEGTEFQVNSSTMGAQLGARVAMDSGGNFVVVWESIGQDGSGRGVFAQRFDGTGTPQGPEFQVNTYTFDAQYGPDIAMGPAGNFVVVWTSYPQDGSFQGIFGQRFDSAGTPQGVEFQVNTHTTDYQYLPAVSMSDSGNFVVVWRSYGQDGSGAGVFGQRFDAAGVPQGPEFQANTFTLIQQYYPAVAMEGSGNFVVVWQSYTQDGDSGGIFGQRFDSAGAPLGGEFQVNLFTLNSQQDPAVGMDAAGNFTVVWESLAQDGSSYGVFGRRFSASGTPQGGEFQVNTSTTFQQKDPEVAVADSSGFIVTWTDDFKDGSDRGIFAQAFDAAAAPVGGEFQANTHTTSAQYFPAIGTDGMGSFVVVWESLGQDGDNSGVFGQRVSYESCSPLPGEVTDLTLDLVSMGSSLRLTWANVSGADDYVIFQDALPGGPFTVVSGTAANGTSGLTIPVPPGQVYYKVAGRSAACGMGPK